ncbi:hypothetical protein [Streptomyces sp. NPDC046759]|uniref:hypothetical protein n=1 Tax=Streptomyces sp. NPDC046759 TaxID=3155019 RepID=UPI0033C7E1BA
MSAINWGDVPTWLGAIFAAAAAGAAVWTLKSQRDQIGEQRAFIAEQAANLRRERQQLQVSSHETHLTLCHPSPHLGGTSTSPSKPASPRPQGGDAMPPPSASA